MPEFEKTNSQPDPEHSYSPSKDASRKQGGRRRSGGFKTETISSSANIGEVDPVEALKSEQLSGSKPTQKTSTDESGHTVENAAPKKQESAKVIENTDDTVKSHNASQTSGPQPSEATLASIQSVEARIARRRQEERGKKSSPVATKGQTKQVKPSRKTDLKNGRGSTSKPKGGLLSAITQFFSNLFGSTPKSKNNTRRKSSGPKNYENKRRGNNSRRGQKNYSQRRGGKNNRGNGQRSTAKSK